MILKTLQPSWLFFYTLKMLLQKPVFERTSVFKKHELTEFQYSKFSKLQLVVHMTMSEVLNNTDEDA